MTNEQIHAIFQRLKQHNPKPTTELKHQTAFELLIAVILSAQATDVSVNKVTPKLFAIANTPEGLLALGKEKLKDYIKTIGLYQAKAANIIKTCEILVNEHQSQVPDNREDLQRLPGVGRKTANVILNTAFGQPVIAVDTHILRVAQRIGLAAGKTPERVERELTRTIPEAYLHDAHHWLILHGRYVCQAKKPLCPQCVIYDLCEYAYKTA